MTEKYIFKHAYVKKFNFFGKKYFDSFQDIKRQRFEISVQRSDSRMDEIERCVLVRSNRLLFPTVDIFLGRICVELRYFLVNIFQRFFKNLPLEPCSKGNMVLAA